LEAQISSPQVPLSAFTSRSLSGFFSPLPAFPSLSPLLPWPCLPLLSCPWVSCHLLSPLSVSFPFLVASMSQVSLFPSPNSFFLPFPVVAPVLSLPKPAARRPQVRGGRWTSGEWTSCKFVIFLINNVRVSVRACVCKCLLFTSSWRRRPRGRRWTQPCQAS